MGHWVYNGSAYEPEVEVTDKSFPYQGFVYIIENLANGRSYIGKKNFTFLKARQVNKKRKRYKVESDWREYLGSSEDLHRDAEQYGTHVFRRTILHLCRSKGEMTYLEAQEQFDRRVILRDDYYNGWISCRVRSSHLKDLREEYSLDNADSLWYTDPP